MEKDNMCRIPVNATMAKVNGKYVMVQADWVDIPADVIARFFLEKSGITPVHKGGEND